MRLKPLVWVKDANLLIEENPPSVCSVYLTQTLREQGGGGATAVPPLCLCLKRFQMTSTRLNDEQETGANAPTGLRPGSEQGSRKRARTLKRRQGRRSREGGV